MTMEVILHVYDVTTSGSDRANSAVLHINRIFKDRFRLGGIFHSAVQVYGEEEWSFGLCELGTGVFCCPSKKNPMHVYRESSNHLLSKNCNHFCDEFCGRLGVQKLPGWVNRFAHAGDTTVEFAGNAADQLRQAKTHIVSAGKGTYRFLAGVAPSTIAPESTESSTRGPTPRFKRRTRLKKLIPNGHKPTSPGPGDHNKNAAQHLRILQRKYILLPS